jgi:hypothetical protein
MVCCRARLVRAEGLAKFYEAVRALSKSNPSRLCAVASFHGRTAHGSRFIMMDDIDFAERVIRLPAKKAKSGASSICL